MTVTTPELDSSVQTVNGFCADLVADSDASSFALEDLRRRIDEHRESHDDPDRAFTALSVACGYTTRRGQPDPHGDLALGEWIPGWIDIEHDSMLTCPPPLDRVNSTIQDRWAELAQETALHPLLRARLADLLSTLGHGNASEFEQIAVHAYLETLADPAIDERERMTALRRLAHLSDELQDPRLPQIVAANLPASCARRGSRGIDDGTLAAA
ncbi:hypothetical protein [Candidatus Poriferisodalis sp.]|uniref:hypothetical protein n=1 Tax=Candidatus Poriferisodalis sp. TaxID=3101277 RepID=UPI003B010B9C